MNLIRVVLCTAHAGLLVVLCQAAVLAGDAPAFLKEVVTNDTAIPKSKTAYNNVYALNSAMMPIYDSRLSMFKDHVRSRVSPDHGALQWQGRPIHSLQARATASRSGDSR